MEIIDFLLMNWSSVLLVIALLTVLIILFIKGEKKIYSQILYTLVTEAEAHYGGGTGELKKAAVISNIYGILPAILKLFITESRLAAWIEEALEYAKKKWAENAQIEGYIKGKSVEDGDDVKPP